MFTLVPNTNFLRKAKKRYRANPRLEKRIERTLALLKQHPFAPALKTHSAIARYDNKPAQSSFVTKDIRIIWRLEKGQIHIIHLIDIGGHSGGRKVYK
jgi:mRNA-degrading endonuclease YafQ of YafQ-DinJ toxin-antitoxin module